MLQPQYTVPQNKDLPMKQDPVRPTSITAAARENSMSLPKRSAWKNKIFLTIMEDKDFEAILCITAMSFLRGTAALPDGCAFLDRKKKGLQAL